MWSAPQVDDVEALTAIYRKIFQFLVARSRVGGDRPAEREIAAALESVFPRAGLRAFTALSPDDKAAQAPTRSSSIVTGVGVGVGDRRSTGVRFPTSRSSGVYGAIPGRQGRAGTH